MNTDHAELGASSSARWLACHGSVALSRPYERRSSFYAAEGTLAHTLAEAAMVGVDLPRVGSVLEIDDRAIEVTDAMLDGVRDYADFVRPIAQRALWHAYEQKVVIKSGPPTVPMFGKADFVALDRSTLVVVDLKFGKGVKVDAVENSQALYYALAAYESVPDGIRSTIREIRIVIVQPRVTSEPQEWTIDLIDLLIWRDDVLMKNVNAIVAGDTSLNDGPWCRFCAALAVCPLKHARAQEAAKVAFDDDLERVEKGIPLNDHNVVSLSPTELAKRIKLARGLVEWLNGLEREAMILIREGEDVPGFKIVEGRSNRKWAAEDAIIQAEIIRRAKPSASAAEELYEPPTLRSPAKVEKVIKRWRLIPQTILQNLIDKPTGKPALVEASDPRPAMKITSAAEEFDDQTEDPV